METFILFWEKEKSLLKIPEIAAIWRKETRYIIKWFVSNLAVHNDKNEGIIYGDCDYIANV